MTASQEFVELCKALRMLGANEVRHGELSAKFEGHMRLVAVTQGEEPAAEPEDEQPLTEEQATEKRYARELGRAT